MVLMTRKLTEEQIASIPSLKASKMSERKIAILFGVSRNCIRYHVDPKRDIDHRARTIKLKIKQRLDIIAFFGGKCIRCGYTDWRALQINHINGGGHADRKRYSTFYAFYRAILTGERSKDDLELLCANCNTIHGFELREKKKAGI